MYPSTCTCFLESPTNNPWRILGPLSWGEVFQTPPNTECLQNFLGLLGHFYPTFVTSDFNDNGVGIVRVDANCIFLRECGHFSWRLGFSLALDI